MKKGFTVVELIVVITIIAILSTIAIISYGPWRESVADGEAKNGLDQLRTAMDDIRNFADDGLYPRYLPTSITNPGEVSVFTTTKGQVTLTINTAGASRSSYCGRSQSVTVPSRVYYINPPTYTTPQTTNSGYPDCATL